MAECACLIATSTSARSIQNQCFSFFVPPCLLVSAGLFVPCAGTMQAVGWGTMPCSESREETARRYPYIILCNGARGQPCLQAGPAVYPAAG